ncbi:signal peptidase I [Leptospira sarikeiensis]|uniref:signal peptidase I n=1 Tax=Leptospira sarikeiensis TaxID=2484943 RepID=UPI0014384892|nr:signal peptidase I [Leptospira sarikeiensis]
MNKRGSALTYFLRPILSKIRFRILVLLLPIGFLVNCDITIVSIFKENVIDNNYIPAGSMEPNLQIGDYIVVKKFNFSPKRGDLITFNAPEAAVGPEESTGPYRKKFVKRLIGLPGDTISYYFEKTSGPEQYHFRVILNDELLPLETSDEVLHQEDFDIEIEGLKLYYERVGDKKYKIFSYGKPYPFIFLPSGEKLTLGENDYFVLGDNRGNSSDSRFWGPIQGEDILGIVVYKYLSFNWKDYTCKEFLERSAEECPKDIFSRFSRMKFRTKNLGPIE